MTSGYLSREAVNDLLAIKNGEIDFLRKQIETLTNKCDSLLDELSRKSEIKCTCY